MTWSRIDIGGKPADVFEPAGASRAALHLHGVGEETLAGDDAYTAALAECGLACVCPHGRRSWWADRVCGEFDPRLTAERHLLDQVVPYIHDRWPATRSGVGVTGISMGGQGALRLAFKYPRLFPAAAAVSAAIDYHEWYGTGTTIDDMYDTAERCRQDTATLHLDGQDAPPHIFFAIDPADGDWFRGNDRLREKLTWLGVPFTADLETRAGGHSWEYFDAMAGPSLRFLADALAGHNRRLL